LRYSNNRGNSGWQRRRKKTEAQSRKAKATTAKKHPVQLTVQTDITNEQAPLFGGRFSVAEMLKDISGEVTDENRWKQRESVHHHGHDGQKSTEAKEKCPSSGR
jgi:hypothetical protein